MPDFVKPSCELTTGEIAALTRATLRTGDPADRRIGNIAPLDAAGPSDLTFLDNSKYAGELSGTRAGACLIAPRFAALAPPWLVVLETPHPYPGFVAVTRKLFPDALRPSSLYGVSGRATAAHVHHTARIEGQRHDRSLRGDRPGRPDRRRHGDRGRRGDRTQCPHRARMRNRRRRLYSSRADRRSRDRPSRRSHRPGRFRIFAQSERAIRKFRRPGASSFRTTSRSAPIPRSTGARPATP